MKPRNYQRDVLEALQADLQPGGKGRLFALPTGTGKGAVQIWHAERCCERNPGKPFLSVQASIPLMQQAAERYKRAGFFVLVEQAERYASPHMFPRIYSTYGQDTKVAVVASYHSLGNPRRLGRYENGRYFCGAHVEEAHHSPSDTQQRIIREFSAVPWTGDTATPERQGMADLWDLVYGEMTFVRAIELGWLTETTFRTVTLEEWDMSRLREAKTSPGGISTRSIMAMLSGHEADPELAYGNEEKMIRDAVARLRHEVQDRSCMSFWPNVASTEIAGKALNEYRPAFAMVGIQAQGRVAGGIEEVRRVREEAVRKARDGDIRDLVLCNLGAEGLDWPDLDTVAIMKPLGRTASILGTQIVGRCARPHSSVGPLLTDEMTAAERRALLASSPKPKAEALLFTGIKAKLQLWHPAQLLGGLKVAKDAPPPPDIRDGMTLDEIRAEMDRRAQEREEADRARLAAEQEKERIAQESGKPRLDVPPAQVKAYTLEEMRAALELERAPVPHRDIKRWQNRVADGDRRPTEEQRQVLARMADIINGTRVAQRARKQGKDPRDIARLAHSAGVSAGRALYEVSAAWAPLGAFREYQYMSHIYEKSPALRKHRIPAWPAKHKKRNTHSRGSR